MQYHCASDADFQHQSFLELRPIAVSLQILGFCAWLASLLLSHPSRQVESANILLVIVAMLGGSLLSWQASHPRTLLLGMLLHLAGLGLGFRLNMLLTTEPGPWATSVAVCIILTMAPVFHSTHAFLLASTGIWVIMLQGTLADQHLWAQDSWVALLITNSMATGLMLNILFRRLRLRGYLLRSKLEVLAFQDALTGIDNRRSLLEKLQAWYPLQQGYFMMVDIDDFKSINDDFGHEAGDQVLREVAMQLNTHPDIDLCGRLGGEEFGLFTRRTNRLQATQVAAELIARVNACHVQQRRVSISIGIVYMDGRVGMSAALRLADQAMYQAKQAGKNCFVLVLPDRHATHPQQAIQT
ncbi:diguanylate cyclase [Aquitalea magnusonii]|uniref:diguanylate cyclase n=1 Tax=Aquitalea magnusonii TaxID=332411 RepID=A0A3G9GLM3_9NEIS|nr:GGDEF domain-containing protein [Aquitalea magnusonii]BBF87439.1 diguanylate cyclase [Aquitalea magnusonii]